MGKFGNPTEFMGKFVCVYIYIYIYYLIECLILHKYDYRFLYKQVIISCEFCQHFKYSEILLSSWVNLWYLKILVHEMRF